MVLCFPLLILVAPHAGAWIETMLVIPLNINKTVSPLTRGRGLKPVVDLYFDAIVPVAPHAGAWIETSPL